MSQAYAHDIMIRVIAQHLNCMGFAVCEAQVLELLCARVEHFISQRGKSIAAMTSHQRRNKSNLLHVLLADPSINDAIVNNGQPLADVQRMCSATEVRTKWLTDKYTSCRRVAKQIRDQGLAVSSFPAKRIAVAERRFGDVADVPQLPLPEELSAYCKDVMLPPLPPLHTVTRTELDPHAERMRQGISSEQRHVEQAIIDLSQSETLEANKARSHIVANPRESKLAHILQSASLSMKPAGQGGAALVTLDDMPIQDAGAVAAFHAGLPPRAQQFSVMLQEVSAADADAQAAAGKSLSQMAKRAISILETNHSADNVGHTQDNTGRSSEAGDSVRH